MPIRTTSTLFVAALILAGAQPACSRSDESPGTGTTPGTSSGAASAAAVPTAAAPTPSGPCPEGRWKYDYKDRFLETLAHSGQSRVVSERGEFTCTITGRERGSYVCETSAGGVENVFEAATAGGPMVVSIKLNGRSKTDFESAGPNRWRSTQADLGGLTMQASATIAGRTLPMPAFNLLPGLDRPGTVLDYQCDGDTLKLKPQIEGTPTEWLHLKRVP